MWNPVNLLLISSCIRAVRSEPLIQELTKTDQFLRLMDSLQQAARITFRFFQTFFYCLYCSGQWLLKPTFHIVAILTYPLRSLAFIAFYLKAISPILLFCLVAVCCGLFIGGCAGFLSEAFSSIIVTHSRPKDPSSLLIRRIHLSKTSKPCLKEDTSSLFS
ncbi:hypothetical protein BY458DRAFT_512965 [Sporodiniella umbellata]|nr:hypothetical protein BY458DRAFT_512965 [Sporodiniella umbellata]